FFLDSTSIGVYLSVSLRKAGRSHRPGPSVPMWGRIRTTPRARPKPPTPADVVEFCPRPGVGILPAPSWRGPSAPHHPFTVKAEELRRQATFCTIVPDFSHFPN